MINDNDTAFWLVWNPNNPKTPRYRHSSKASADIETARHNRRAKLDIYDMFVE